MDSQTGKYIMIIGGAILVIGAVIYFFGGSLKWIGRLPGDIRIEKEKFRFYFPITTGKSLLKSSQQEEAPLEPKLVFLSYKQATPLESTNDISL